MTDTTPKPTPDFVSIATPLVTRGFRVTPVHPETKMGVMRNWSKFQATNVKEVISFGKSFPNYNVGVVGRRGRNKDGSWRICFFDDDSGVVSRIESQTGHTMPATYTVMTRPVTNPVKRHFYFNQTEYSFKKFGDLRRKHGFNTSNPWDSKNINVRDVTRLELSRKGNLIHPTVYDVKGIGGGSLVVAAGSVRDTGEVYTAVDPTAPVSNIPDWLVDWICDDYRVYREAVRLERDKKSKSKARLLAKGKANRIADCDDETWIYEEDIVSFIWSRSGSLASLGIPSQEIETALKTLVTLYCARGNEFVERNAQLFHEIAFNDDLKIIPPTDWYSRLGFERSEEDDDDHISIPDWSPAQERKRDREERLTKMVNSFPKVGMSPIDVHNRFEDALAEMGIEFHRERSRARERVSKTMRACGWHYDSRRAIWIPEAEAE
jgi:hypothetical protein